MKKSPLLLIAFGLFMHSTRGQTRADSVQLIRNTVSLYDLDFTEAEADSMIGNLRYYHQLYKGMHNSSLTNDVPYPFAFHPAPVDMKISTKREKMHFQTSADLSSRLSKMKNGNTQVSLRYLNIILFRVMKRKLFPKSSSNLYYLMRWNTA